MENHSPPGPGWELGDDGHWKPPPMHMGGGGLPPGQGFHPAPPVASGGSPKGAGGRTAAFVVAAVIAVLVVAVGGVTLLGTSDEKPSGLDVGPSEGDRSDEDRAEPTGELGTTALTSILDAADPVTGPLWTVVEDADIGPSQPQAPCAPEGMAAGKVAGRGRTWGYQVAGGASSGTLTVSVYEYGTSEEMSADLDRVRSDAYRDCQLGRLPYQFPAEVVLTEPAVERLDIPLGLDGVRYRTTVHTSDGTTEQDRTDDLYVVGLGRLRVVVDATRCCYTWDESGELTVLASVVAAAAEALGLPLDDQVETAGGGTFLSEGPDPCALLTVDDVVAAGLPAPAAGGEMTHGDQGDVLCRWSMPDGTEVQLTTTVGGYRFDPPQRTPVDGLGDSAEWVADGADLVVRVGGRTFLIGIAGGDVATARPQVLALARAVLDHLAGPG